MMAFIAFIKKEWMESVRTYKFFILITVFLLFGFMNPIIAKVMPEMLTSLLPEGMTITLAPPAAIDSWMQFFKNVSQTGLMVLVVIYSGLMASEFSKGTLVNMLTKGLPRQTVVLSKMLAATTLWTLSYLICVGVTYAYTAYFWTMSGIDHLFLALFGLWLFGTLLLALVLLGGIIFKNIYGSLLFTGAGVVVMTVVNIFPAAKPFNPSTLSSSGILLLTGGQDVADFVSALGISAVLIALLLALSIVIFNKKQV